MHLLRSKSANAHSPWRAFYLVILSIQFSVQHYSILTGRDSWLLLLSLPSSNFPLLQALISHCIWYFFSPPKS
ncbi:hypothetical protein L228DRAFT_145266 [Xylona heveae TC161]|uniref:Uncharacterized protein n=1 Tax=Xylona heveae (strain CBS 132557 / TC161) TaxID=1328760 RepID=A0A165GCQ1_XYLHT|nr:hypothetical protein L228DRAFT_145266 [Xylona heveae TC161]KZF22034.1 hypothetical protein L228DRAFT_145266 [Xylona heveae TC161]